MVCHFESIPVLSFAVQGSFSHLRTEHREAGLDSGGWTWEQAETNTMRVSSGLKSVDSFYVILHNKKILVFFPRKDSEADYGVE